MRVQLFISNHAAEGHRLQTVLQGAVPNVPATQFNSPWDVGREALATYDEKIVAVIMAANRKELSQLAQMENIRDRLWIVLVLPDSAPESISLGHILRPRFVTFADSDFTDIVAILNHIRRDIDEDVRI